MKNIRIAVEYDGTSFAGWQRQSGRITTVQGQIEAALGMILQEKISLAAAGRTDKGVHAKAQIANFLSASTLELPRIVHSLNCVLPDTIRVSDPREMPYEFHARHSARQRQYRYFLLEEPSAIYGRFAGCSYGKPDIEVMQAIAASILGTHDFTAFSKEDRDNPGRLCTVTASEWYRYDRYLVFQISANRFLRSMVRYLVDTMVCAGNGALSVEEFQRMLDGRVISNSVKPAIANGLFLWKVTY